MVTIAIAEDNPAEMGLLKKAVAVHKNWQLQLTAVDGKDLLDKLEKLQLANLPNILLLDIKMPRLDGLTVTSYCKLKYPSIRIIGVSSHTHQNLVREVITEGALGFISKYFLYPESHLCKSFYDTIDLLEVAINTVLKDKQFIDKLIMNEPELFKPSIATYDIIAKNYQHLTLKYIEFAILNATGSLTQKEIATLMCVSVGSIKNYCNAFAKIFSVGNRHEVASRCTQYGITKLANYFDAAMNNAAWA